MAKKQSTEVILAESGFGVNQEIDLPDAKALVKDLLTNTVFLDQIQRSEIRTLVDNFYQMQADRKRKTEQIRAIKTAADPTGENKNAAAAVLKWFCKYDASMEAGIEKILLSTAQANEVGQWLLQIKGIGPILSAGLLAYFDVEGRNYASQFISYAGLNDNNRPWLGSEKAKKIVNDVIQEMAENTSKKSIPITDDMVVEIARRTQWSYNYLLGRAYDKDKKKWSKDKLCAACAIPPYNKSAKTLMWKVGSSFVWLRNDQESMYGRLYNERVIYETEKNERGEYAEIAEAILASKNFDKSTTAYKEYSKGRLPKAHIAARAQRWVEKIFLSHLFEEMYRVKYNKIPSRYYTLEHVDGHHKELPPEVPYKSVPGDTNTFAPFDHTSTTGIWYDIGTIEFKSRRKKKDETEETE